MTLGTVITANSAQDDLVVLSANSRWYRGADKRHYQGPKDHADCNFHGVRMVGAISNELWLVIATQFI